MAKRKVGGYGGKLTYEGTPLTGPGTTTDVRGQIRRYNKPQMEMPIPDEELARKIRRRRQTRRGRSSTVLTGETLGTQEQLA